MKIFINKPNGECQEIIFSENFENIYAFFKKFSPIKEPLEVKMFAINEAITSQQLSKLKNNFDKHNYCFYRIYSNNRDTILAGKSLKINSIFLKEKEIKNKLLFLNSKQKEDILYEGTVRSGNRISSNGNLCIVGDVNPGAIISAKKNIYVWGKLLGIAFAGKEGDNDASISSLYLNPLQLRIADVIAIGPKNKPKNYYPEIALVDNKSIIIQPFIIDNRN